MTNLLKETLDELQENGKSFECVLWIGSEDGHITKELFLELANIDYDNGYGGQEIASDLVLVGDGWWLERGEYDGSEWWEFKSPPVMPKNQLHPIRLHNGIWNTLREMENESNY